MATQFGRRVSGWSNEGKRTPQAFTLIEMLVVISIIGILAGLLFTAGPTVSFKRKKAVAAAEMNEIMMALNSFKATYNAYPQSNPNNTRVSSLLYELAGTTYASAPSDQFSLSNPGSTVTATNALLAFGVGGFLNATMNGSDPTVPKAKEFLPAKPNRYALYDASGTITPVYLLTCSVGGPASNQLFYQVSPGVTNYFNPWNYVAYSPNTSPTNNPTGFDLWVEIQSGNRSARISNWAPPLNY